MSFSTRHRRARNRQATLAMLRVGKWGILLAIFMAIGYGAHETGSKLARVEVDRLGATVQDLEQQRTSLQDENARLRAELAQAQAATRQVQHRYDTDVPRGALAEVAAAARERLQSGLDRERLTQVVRAAQPLRRCDGPAITRRFRIGVGTGDRVTDDNSTSFAEGLMRVSAAIPLGTEDFARATTVTFTGLAAGAGKAVTGLPANFSYVVNNHDMRMTVTESPVRGFVQASLTTCR